MARLSNIFANLNGESDLIKQKYFAEKIVECFEVQGLTEGYVFSDFDLTTIENKIITEALKKDSLKESLQFVDGVMQQIDEGFFSAIKNIGKDAWEGIKKVGSKIKDAISKLWNGQVVAAIKKWNATVSSAADKLEGLSDSLTYKDTSYLLESDRELNALISNLLLEADVAGTANQTQILDQEENGGEPQNNQDATSEDDLSKLDASVKNIVSLFATSGGKSGGSGIGITGFKYFSVVKNGTEKVLSFGNNKDDLVPLVKGKVGGMALKLTVPAGLKGAALNLVRLVVNSIKTTTEFGFDSKMDPTTYSKIVKRIVKPGNAYILTKSGKISAATSSTTDTTSPDTATDSKTGKPTDSTDSVDAAVDAATSGFTKPGEPNPAAADPTTPVGGEKTDATDSSTSEPKPTAEKSENQKIIDGAIDSSGIKDNGDKFYDNMNTTSEEVWSAFDKFARHHGYRITGILKNSTANINNVEPMNELEYLAYLANMNGFISNLKSQPVPSEFDAANYQKFLNVVLQATGPLAQVVNRKMTATGQAPTTGTKGGEQATISSPETRVEPEIKDELMDEETFNKTKL